MSLSCFVSLDAIVHDIGSSATLGNTSNSPETGGAYVIPTAMMTKDGYILAWELVASKLGPIRLQVSFQGTLVPALPWWSSPSLYYEKIQTKASSVGPLHQSLYRCITTTSRGTQIFFK